MQMKSKGLFSVGHTELFMQEKGLHSTSTRKIVRNLLFFCIALVFSMPLTWRTWATEQQNTENHENLDTRWLPWIGSWRLVSNTLNTVGTVFKEEYLLTIRPDDKGEFVTMESSRDKTVMFEEKIEADGVRHPLNKDECTGWYSYSWSETGKRLLFKGESSCTGNLSQKISGILFIDTIGDCVDIKLFKSGEEKAITIRRYRSVESNFVAPLPTMPTKASVARMSAGSKFSIDEVIELSNKVEPDVLEAALVEMGSPFPINSKQLVHLSDAKVPSQIVDLVVALSFPEKFTVERTALSWVKTVSDFYAPYYYWPMSPWYWTSSVYPLYGYQYWGWDWYQQYGWYYYPYRYRYYSPHGGGSGTDSTHSNGRLVAGQGYTRVYSGNSGPQKRYAHPRNAQATNGTTASSSASSSASSGGASSGASAGAGGYSAPSASPSGYSSGGYSTGSAQPH